MSLMVYAHLSVCVRLHVGVCRSLCEPHGVRDSIQSLTQQTEELIFLVLRVASGYVYLRNEWESMRVGQNR